MKASIRNLFPNFYDARQIESSVRHVGTVDRTVRCSSAPTGLRGLGTRILESCEAAAKGRGFRMRALMATLPGVLIYERYGFQLLEHSNVAMPDGVSLLREHREADRVSRGGSGSGASTVR